MLRKKLIALIFFMSMLLLTACQGNVANDSIASTSNSTDTNVLFSDSEVPDIPASADDSTKAAGYQAAANFMTKRVSQDGSESYIPILDDIVYNGGELNICVEYNFSGTGHNIQKTDALAMFFVDGYMQEFSLEDDEPALIHNIIVENNVTARINYKCTPVSYDGDSEEHTICAVMLPYWTIGYGNFVRDTAVMAVSRKIILNTVNMPAENNIIQMSGREKTPWDNEHSEIPFKQNYSNLILHCHNEEKTICYLFCDGKLVSKDGKYMFANDSGNSDKTSFVDISTDEFDVDKPCYVLYVPKDAKGIVERTCNYTWNKGESQ